MAMNVRYEKDGVTTEHLLDVVHVPFSHTGVNLSKAFVQAMDRMEVTEKVASSYILS